MQRVLNFSVASLALVLAGCAHPAFKTVVENGTKNTLDVFITYSDPSVPPSHGKLNPGEQVNLVQATSDLDSIQYEFASNRCILQKRIIEQSAQAIPGGMKRILITNCPAGLFHR